MHRRRDQPHRVGRARATLHERVRRRHLERLEALRVAQVRVADRGGRAARAHQRAPPDVRRAVAARDAAAADLLSRRDADLPAREQRRGAGLRAPRSRHRRARRIDGGVRRRARLADAGRTRVRVPARRLHSPGLAHLRQRPPQLGRHLPLRHRAPVSAAADARCPCARARRLARRHPGRVRRRQRRAGAPARRRSDRRRRAAGARAERARDRVHAGVLARRKD